MHRSVRIIVASALAGALSLGAAWAGAVLSPVPDLPVPGGVSAAGSHDEGDNIPPGLPGLRGDEVLAGAAKVNIAPQPNPANGDVWETDRSKCETLSSAFEEIPANLADVASLWPENGNCIYTGGYGIGPMNAVSAFDEDYGLWARAFALSDGTQTIALAVVDGTYWQGRYARMCPACGALDLGEQLGAELADYGLRKEGVFIAATHSHTAPDFIGGWGGVPRWYHEQVAEAIRDAIRQAVTGMRPAKLEAGEELARDWNGDRRKTYRSAQEAGLSWLRAVSTDDDEVIVTVGAYAAHPTKSPVNGTAHGDWPAVFNARLEERFGGVGIHFMTGLGQMTGRGSREQLGLALADLVPKIGRGEAITDPVVTSAAYQWDQPITNGPLAALGGAGLFDRPFGGPAQVNVGRSSQRPCVSQAAVSVRTQINAARVGKLVFTGAPGETFSNLSNSIKEGRTGQITFPLAIINDGLGYIMQSFEHFDESRQGLGFAGSSVTEYEDAYAIDGCFGDMVMEHSLRLVNEVWG